METIKNIWTLKKELKQLAAELRTERAELKKEQREGKVEASIRQYTILKKRKNYRHRHIAYCLLRGRTYEQIESHCRQGNEPDQTLIQELISEYRTDNVRACA